MNHFINLKDIPAKDLRKIIIDAKKRKSLRKKLSTLEVDKGSPLKGKILIQMFEKASSRTRISFYLAIKQLGGGTLTLRSNELHLGQGGESIADTAKILSTYGDGFMLRTDSDKKLENFRRYLSIPIINGLSPSSHPTQVLSDIFTVEEIKKKPISKLNICWIGDANNVLDSLIAASVKFSFKLSIGCPIGVSVDELSRLASGNLNVSSDATEPMDAVAEGQKMLSDAMGGLDKTLAVTNFGLKGISKYLAKRNQAKIAAEATEKAVTKGIPKALETLAKGPKNLDGSPNKKFKSNKQAIETLSKELGAESAEAIGKKAVTKKVTEKVVQETVEQGSKLGLKATIGKVPVLSLITGAVFAGKEIMQGDFVGAGMEIASGVSATLGALSFGGGTAVSYGIDGAILARELYQASQTLTKLEEDLNKEIQTLNAEDQAKVAAAMQGTEEQMMEFIKANDSWFGKSGNQLDNVAELLQKILNEQKSLPTNMTKE